MAGSITSQPVRRILVGRNGADGVPGVELFRQLRSGQIGAKCAQIGP
jgi:hypothetical protein